MIAFGQFFGGIWPDRVWPNCAVGPRSRWAPKGWAPNRCPLKGSGSKPTRLGPQGGGPEGWAKIYRFFHLPPQFSFFLPSLGCSLVELWARPAARRGPHKDSREPKRALWVDFGLEPRPQFHEKTPQERGKKNAKFWAVRGRRGEGRGGLYFSSRQKRKQLFKSWVCGLIVVLLILCFFFFSKNFHFHDFTAILPFT